MNSLIFLPLQSLAHPTLVGVFLLAAASACPARAQEAIRDSAVAAAESCDGYRLIVFSSQSVPRVPRATHNWGVAVRLRSTPAGLQVVAADTISWMPQSMRIEPQNVHVEPGWNVPLGTTFDYLTSERQRISVWGVVQLSPEYYEAFLARKAQLESGVFGYQCLDTIGEAGRTKAGVNCVHGLSDFADLMKHVPIMFQPYGDESAARIVAALHERGCCGVGDAEREWLLSSLGVNQWPIRRRSPAHRSTTSIVAY